ncbi:MAG TPA: stage III sporulation protein AA [Clostridiales bacterium]|nr:stage III sporulation protein AA [Clostridiales bacterium]
MLNLLETILYMMPEELQNIISSIPSFLSDDLEEIRIRELRPLSIISGGKNYYIDKYGNPCLSPTHGYIVTNEQTQRILQLISNYSIYALEDELRNGYITLKGGFRVGLAGQTVLENGKIKTFKNINSFNFRISREIKGVADKVMPMIIESDQIMDTLIISPPGMGKTTLLRDIARQLSNGFEGFEGVKVSIVDERSEISGSYKGIPQNDIGYQTDILDACPKAEGIMLLIRSMSPDVIITDEIGRNEDIKSIEEAINAGVRIITTAHGKDLNDTLSRPTLKNVVESGFFHRILILGNSKGIGTLEKVYDGRNMKELLLCPIKL